MDGRTIDTLTADDTFPTKTPNSHSSTRRVIATIPLARGSVNYLLGRLDPAIAAYREALALEARPEIHLNLGRALRAQGLLAEAERELARAVRLDPRLAAEAR